VFAVTAVNRKFIRKLRLIICYVQKEHAFRWQIQKPCRCGATIARFVYAPNHHLEITCDFFVTLLHQFLTLNSHFTQLKTMSKVLWRLFAPTFSFHS
jgi:hypothetical protein